MPRFFFDVRDKDGISRDGEGLNYENIEDAVADAERALHEMARDEPSADSAAIAIDIRNEDESLVTVVASTTVLPNSTSKTRRKIH